MNKSNYDRAWKKEISRELRIHGLIRNSLNKFTDKDYDNLIRDLASVKHLFTESRDNALGLAMKLICRKPALLKYGLISYLRH